MSVVKMSFFRIFASQIPLRGKANAVALMRERCSIAVQTLHRQCMHGGLRIGGEGLLVKISKLYRFYEEF
jgi:hypothetical protein